MKLKKVTEEFEGDNDEQTEIIKTTSLNNNTSSQPITSNNTHSYSSSLKMN